MVSAKPRAWPGSAVGMGFDGHRTSGTVDRLPTPSGLTKWPWSSSIWTTWIPPLNRLPRRAVANDGHAEVLGHVGGLVSGEGHWLGDLHPPLPGGPAVVEERDVAALAEASSV